MKHRKNPVPSHPFLLLSILLSVVIIAGCTLSAFRYNQNLKNSFVLTKPNNVYARQEELTVDSLSSVIPILNIAKGGAFPQKEKLPVTLLYYRSPKDWFPEKILLRGTDVMSQVVSYGDPERYTSLDADSGKYHYFYGFACYPSYQRGWRVVIPLITAAEYNKGIEPESYQLRYIRTSTYERLKKVWFRQETLKNPETKIGQTLDEYLYEEGYYLSPDLYRSYCSAPVKLVLSAWILTAILQITRSRRGRYQKKL